MTTENLEQSKTNYVQLAGLWKNTNADGSVFYSARVGSSYWIVKRNQYKTKPEQPDFILYAKQPNPQPPVAVEPADEEAGELA